MQLDSGETIRVGYADQNGHPYRSIGRLLVERGELALEQASMQSIKAWGRANPDRLGELLNSNASYVFFRELPATTNGPPGSLGVPLTAAAQHRGRSALRSARRSGVHRHHVAEHLAAAQPPDARAGHRRRDTRVRSARISSGAMAKPRGAKPDA